jgi:hypothetical protein
MIEIINIYGEFDKGVGPIFSKKELTFLQDPQN